MFSLLVCMYVHRVRMQCPGSSEEAFGYPGSGVIGDHEQPCGCWQTNLGPQQEQLVFFIQPSLALALNSWSSCLYFPSARIIAKHRAPVLALFRATLSCFSVKFSGLQFKSLKQTHFLPFLFILFCFCVKSLRMAVSISQLVECCVSCAQGL